MADTPIRRCAVYTRKSSEEGLEKDFNSLHAQREACEAFIKSQAGEGWKLVTTNYDDGGLSGGILERPALQRLLEDIRRGLLDSVVVYKVDRLTRSLVDFAKIVELFDAQGVSFVAVTQQFNTTTSMGRLTLNVLLSFAQFEREVIGERIRDKVAASKRKGIWMGGKLPLGYDVCDRRLVINPVEGKVVIEIFERYLQLGSVRLLQQELARHGVVSRVKSAKNGSQRGGKPFSRGALYCLLSNRIYVGEIRHKREAFAGQHEPIVSRELWERVQVLLQRRTVRQGAGCKTAAPRSPLAGKLFDENNSPLYVQGAAKGRRRYRYYVSRKLVRGGEDDAGQGWRVSAPEIERAVVNALVGILTDDALIALACEEAGIETDRLPAVLRSAQGWLDSLRDESKTAEALVALLERLELGRNGIRIALKLPLPSLDDPEDPPGHVALVRSIPMQLKQRGVELRIVLAGDSASGRIDLPLLKAVARSRRLADNLIAGRIPSLRALAKREGVNHRSLARLLRLGFLSPIIVEAIATGRQPPDLTLTSVMRRRGFPLLWSAQEHALSMH